MLRQNTRIQIVPKAVAEQMATAIEYRAANESVVGMRYFDASGIQIASTTVAIPLDAELDEAAIFAAAEVTKVYESPTRGVTKSTNEST